jgi:hypothetical protein
MGSIDLSRMNQADVAGVRNTGLRRQSVLAN